MSRRIELWNNTLTAPGADITIVGRKEAKYYQNQCEETYKQMCLF